MSTGDLKHLFLLFFFLQTILVFLDTFERINFLLIGSRHLFLRGESIGKCKTQNVCRDQTSKDIFQVFIHRWQLFATLGQNFKQSGDKNFHICRLNVRIHFG